MSLSGLGADSTAFTINSTGLGLPQLAWPVTTTVTDNQYLSILFLVMAAMLLFPVLSVVLLAVAWTHRRACRDRIPQIRRRSFDPESGYCQDS